MYQKEKDAYQKSILKAKLNRVLLELDQKIANSADKAAAQTLKSKLEGKLKGEGTTNLSPKQAEKLQTILSSIEELAEQLA